MRYDEFMMNQGHIAYLENTAERYRAFINNMENGKKGLAIWGVGYKTETIDAALVFDIDYPVDSAFILTGVKHALRKLEREIAKLKRQSESVKVTL